MNKVYALPLSGDAFLMQREIDDEDNIDRTRSINILVDGGGSQNLIGELKKLKVEKLDIAVCTHSDADHINGLIWLYKKPNIKVEQLWVPGEWFDITAQLKLNPNTFYKSLIEKILAEKGIKADVVMPIIQSLEELSIIRSIKQREVISSIYKPILDLALIVGNVDRKVAHKVGDAFHLYGLTIDRIIELVSLALKTETKVRWFQFDPNNRQGGEAYLKPVNSVEVAKTAKSSMSNINLLSIQNENALVFHSPLNDKCDVLFSSDSNFVFNFASYSLQPVKLLFTAPHHGSKNNANAFKEIAKISNKNTVCLKCRTHTVSIGQDFLNISNRYCNACNSPKTASKTKQLVCFELNKWSTTGTPRACSCVLGI